MKKFLLVSLSVALLFAGCKGNNKKSKHAESQNPDANYTGTESD